MKIKVDCFGGKIGFWLRKRFPKICSDMYLYLSRKSSNYIIKKYINKDNEFYKPLFISIETINRCAFMNDFGEDNAKVIIMWGQVKASTNMTPYYIILILALSFIPGYFVFKFIKDRSTRKYATYRNNVNN